MSSPSSPPNNKRPRPSSSRHHLFSPTELASFPPFDTTLHDQIPIKVKMTCLQQAANKSKHVAIDLDEVDKLAKWAATQKPVEWDTSNWHCNATQVGIENAVLYVFVLDALNFCFWPSDGAVEYSTLAIALKDAMMKDSHSFDGKQLQHMTANKFNTWLPLPDKMEWPLLERRVMAMRELGEAIMKYGEPITWLADSSAGKLVQLIADRLPMFRDETNGVCFYKRAMILVADVWAATGRNTTTTTDGIIAFPDIHVLAMFSDYRVPQILRERGVLVYSKELEQVVDNKADVPAGSQFEIEIRAASVAVVELLRVACQGRFLSVELDWMLWQEGERTCQDMKPAHRTLTSFY